VRWFLGAEEVEVRAVDLDERDHYTGAAILAMAGQRVVLESGELTAHVWDEHVQLYFERGWIRASSEPLLLRNAPAEVELYRVEGGRATRQLIAPLERTWAYREELVHFAECLREDRPFRSPAADALHDVEALERIYRAHVDAIGGEA
jgi:predicted dehydrogenase